MSGTFRSEIGKSRSRTGKFKSRAGTFRSEIGKYRSYTGKFRSTSGTFISEIEKCRSLTGHSGQVQPRKFSSVPRALSPMEYLDKYLMAHNLYINTCSHSLS